MPAETGDGRAALPLSASLAEMPGESELRFLSPLICAQSHSLTGGA